jgi:hypothetical protein
VAIALPHINILIALKNQGVDKAIPISDMMEFGEQNWFMDVDPSEIYAIISHFYSGEKAKTFTIELDEIMASNDDKKIFTLAKFFYRVIFDYKHYSAIDLNGTSSAVAFDLNHQIDTTKKYDLVTNLGTSEHVFNQFQFFKNIHDITRPGGLMIHSLPNQGCYDHGFYNYHPTFFFDLADVNQYGLIGLFYVDASQSPAGVETIDRTLYVKMAVEGQLSNYSGLMAFFQKNKEAQEFKVPIQGYYDNKLPPELADAWIKLPR